MFGQNREELRRFFQTSWEKRLNGHALQPLEQLVAQVIEQHPEYHRHLAGDTNPWLHMGMHITLAEQIGSDRPAGIRGSYQQVVARFGDHHSAEHAMMDCLGVALWEAQRNGIAPDELSYMECLKKLGS